MVGMQETVVVVPCYNEEKRLEASAFLDATRLNSKLQFLFVNDGSSDGTESLLEGLVREGAGRLHVLNLERNRGKAEAVRQGILRASRMRPAVVGFLDADLATPIGEVPRMCAAFENPALQVVLGSRVALLGRDVRRSPLRHYLGRAFGTTAAALLQMPVYDTQCGAKLLRNTALVELLFGEQFSTRWSFDVEMLARLQRLSRQGRAGPIAEIALEFPLWKWEDVAGSKLSLLASARAVGELLLIWERYR